MEEQGESVIKTLHRAVEENDVEAVKEILKENSSIVDERTFNGYTPLMMAATRGQLEMMKVLLFMGANMELRSKTFTGGIDDTTILHIAICHNNSEVTKFIVSQTHKLINSKDRFGETPIFIALFYGHVEMLKFLVTSGANIYERNMEGQTFLHTAARSGKLENFMYALEKNKEALNAVDMDGNTPLLNLIFWHWEIGKESAIDAILKAGADYTIKNKKGNSCIKLAARTRQLNVVTRLIRMGSGLSWIDQDALTEILCLLAEIEEPVPKNKKIYSSHLFDPPAYKCRVEEAIEDILQAAGIKQNFRDERGIIIPGAAEKQIINALLSAGLNINAHGMNRNTPLIEATKGGNIHLFTSLIAAGADVNIPCCSGTPVVTQNLHNIKILDIVISAGADVNALDFWGNTPLHSALHRRSLEVVDLLVTSGADVNLTNNNGHSVLLRAIMEGQFKIAEYLIQKGADVNFIEPHRKETGLHFAVKKQDYEFVEFLIKAGANVNSTNEEGFTPLHIAAKGRYKQCVETLLTAGAIVDAVSEDGRTPFHMAASCGLLEIMKLLDVNGANKVIRDHKGWSALHYAAKCGKLEAFEFLLEHGLDPRLSNENGDTVLHIAVTFGHLHITNFILKNKLIPIDEKNILGQTPLTVAADDTFMQILLHSGASTEVMDNEGKTAFHLAAVKGNVRMLQSLESAGANITAKDNSNRTALHWAAVGVHIEALKYILQQYLLLQSSEDINVQKTDNYCDSKVSALLDCVNDKDDLGLTPFMLVVKNAFLHHDYEKALKVLLEHGANIKASYDKQKTALHIAIDNSNFEVIKSLVSLGSDIKDLDYEYLNTMFRVAAGRGHCEIVKQLVLAGAEPGSRDSATGKTVLHLASIAGSRRTVEYLLGLNVSVDEPDSEGCTALHCAAQGAHVGVVQCLLEKGHAAVDARDDEGMTPLMKVVGGWRDNCEREILLEVLQQAGADFHAVNLAGKNPLEIAASNGHPNVLRRLEVLIYASAKNNHSRIAH